MTGLPSFAADEDPAPILGLLEGPRFLLELQAFLFCAPWLLSAPRGDGHPVMVLPGVSGTDASTLLARSFLADRGFAVYGWRSGPNRGLRFVGGIDALRSRLNAICDRHGDKASLVGFSLGGSQARRLAALAPDVVRRVISVGSPVRERLQTASPETWRVFEHVGGRFVGREAVRSMAAAASPAPDAPSVSIYSRSDGVVASGYARLPSARDFGGTLTEAANEHGENIEVVSGHYGLLVNPGVFYALADRLAQPAEGWKPFRPRGLARAFFGPTT